jgi:hypothetical protein
MNPVSKIWMLVLYCVPRAVTYNLTQDVVVPIISLYFLGSTCTLAGFHWSILALGQILQGRANILPIKEEA